MLEYFNDPESPLGHMDLVYALFLLYGLLRGLFRGFALEFASILGTLVTLWGAWSFYPAVSQRLLDNNLLENEMASQVLAYLLLVLLILTVWRVITAVLTRLLRFTMPPQLQRPGGALIGVLKSVLILIILLLAVQLSPMDQIRSLMVEQSGFGRLIRDRISLEGLPDPAVPLRKDSLDESGHA